MIRHDKAFISEDLEHTPHLLFKDTNTLAIGVNFIFYAFKRR